MYYVPNTRVEIEPNHKPYPPTWTPRTPTLSHVYLHAKTVANCRAIYENNFPAVYVLCVIKYSTITWWLMTFCVFQEWKWDECRGRAWRVLGQLRAAYVPQSLVVTAVEPPTSLPCPPPLRQRQQKRLEWTRQRWVSAERALNAATVIRAL